MKDVRKSDFSREDKQEIIAIKKILKEKYPDEDIEKIFAEGDLCKLHEMLFTP